MAPLNLKSLLATASLALFLSSCQNTISPKTAQNSQADTVIATYKGGQVTLKDVNYELGRLIAQNSKLKGLAFEKLTSEQKELVVKEVILKEMAYREAKRRDLDDDKEYQIVLKNFEAELLKQKLLLNLVQEASDEKNVKKNYDELVAKLKDKKDLRISYIAVKTQSEAENIYQLLVKHPNYFASQARKKSIDKETAKKGGDLGFIVEDILPVDVAKQAKNLQKTQISAPFATNGKWLIIKLDDERPAQILPYEKAKESLAQNLAKKAMEDFVTQSFEKSKMNILVK